MRFATASGSEAFVDQDLLDVSFSGILSPTELSNFGGSCIGNDGGPGGCSTNVCVGNSTCILNSCGDNFCIGNSCGSNTCDNDICSGFTCSTDVDPAPDPDIPNAYV